MSDVISPADVKSLMTLTCSFDHCTKCEDSPSINYETWRAEDKQPMTVYGRNGSYQVQYPPSPPPPHTFIEFNINPKLRKILTHSIQTFVGHYFILGFPSPEALHEEGVPHGFLPQLLRSQRQGKRVLQRLPLQRGFR